MTLEEILREAATKGLTHLTLYPTFSDDRKTTHWCARATPSTGHQYISASDIDPIKVLTTVLVNLPRAKKRTDAKIDQNRGSTYPAQNEITATVTEPDAKPGATGLHPELENEIDKWLPKT